MQKAIFLAVQEHLIAAGLGVEHFDETAYRLSIAGSYPYPLTVHPL